jgi:sortase B
MRRNLNILTAVLTAGILLILNSCGVIGEYVSALKPESVPEKDTAAISEAAELTETDSATTETTANDEHIPEIETENIPPVLEVNPKFIELLQINTEVVGEIKIEGTIIDYPVMFSGENQYYLEHDINGGESKYGCAFMDMGNSGAILDENTIISGHSFKNDPVMFGELANYKTKEFFDSHRKIIFNNLYSDMEWEVFAVYTTPAEWYMFTKFGTFEFYKEFLEYVKENAIFWVDFTPQKDDRLLTLNTCSYEYDGAHTVVMARLVKKTDNVQK